MAIHGKDGVLLIEDSGGTFRNLSGEVVSVNLPFEAPEEETTGFGDSWQDHVVGIKGGNLTFDGNWTETASTGTHVTLWGVLGSVTEFDWAPAGSSSGHWHYSGSFLVTGYNPTATVRGKVGFTCGGPTKGTVTAASL